MADTRVTPYTGGVAANLHTWRLPACHLPVVYID